MIEIKSITYSHSSEPLLVDFSATINSGEAVLVTGRNGAGKSTLLSLIAGSTTPQSGAIEINGKDISKVSGKALAQIRSVAPQRRTFSLAFTVQEVLHFIHKKHRSPLTLLVIEKLGLDELLTQKVTELSGGQQQRVSIALALIQEADFYLLDEPFAAQDSQSITEILELIAALTAMKKGVLVISHNADALHSSFDREIKL
jgi:ABC-type multidrug transport system ATPase subunit